MADEEIRIPIVVPGAEESAAQTDSVASSVDKLAASEKKATAELNRYITVARNANREDREREKAVASLERAQVRAAKEQEKAARDAAKAQADALAQAADAARRQNEAMQKAADADRRHTETVARGYGTQAASVGKVGNAINGLTPLLGSMASSSSVAARSVGALGQGMTALVSVMAGGPGALFGGAIAVTGLLVTAYQALKGGAEEAAQGIDTTTRSLDDYIQAAQKAAQQQALLDRLRSNTASTEETQGALDKARADLAATRAARQQMSEAGRAAVGAAGPQDARTVALSFAAQQRQLAERERELEATTSRLSSVLESRRGIAEGEQAFAEAMLDAEDAGLIRDGASRAKPARRERDRGAEELDRFLEERRAGLDESLYDDYVPDEDHSEKVQAFADIVDEAAARQRDAAASVQDAWTQTYGAIQGAAGDMMGDIITGEKLLLDQRLKQLGGGLVAQGTQHTLQGLGYSIASAGIDPRGPAMMGLGAKEMAIGAAMGAAGAAMASGGGGGVSSGGGGRVEPVPDRGRGSDAPGNVTNINVNEHIPDARTGARVAEALRAAEYKRGHAARSRT